MGKHKMYENSPKMEHDDKGVVKVTKDEKSAEKKAEVKKDDGDTDEEKSPGAHENHSQDIKDMHKRHHAEFKDMHARHEKEMTSMHTKHQKTAGATGGQTTDAPIDKVEKGAKA